MMAGPAAGRRPSRRADRVHHRAEVGRRQEKVEIIKAVRAITGLGLKGSQGPHRGRRHRQEGVSKDDAAKFKKDLEAAGATVEVK